jgi:hypothetical protein
MWISLRGSAIMGLAVLAPGKLRLLQRHVHAHASKEREADYIVSVWAKIGGVGPCSKECGLQ